MVKMSHLSHGARNCIDSVHTTNFLRNASSMVTIKTDCVHLVHERECILPFCCVEEALQWNDVTYKETDRDVGALILLEGLLCILHIHTHSA